MRDAACHDQGDLFFSDKRAQQQQARQLCQACPVFYDCLHYALAHPELEGIWADTNENERDDKRNRQQQQAQ